MKRLAVLVIAAACGDGTDPLPNGGGGGGGGTGGTFQPDASIVDGDGGTAITGRVCLLVDARLWTTCAATGAAGITVALGDQQTTAADDGTFTLARPTGTGLVWRISGSAIQAAAMRASALTMIPAVPLGLYEDMLSATNAVLVAGSGAVIARVTRGGSIVIGATVDTTPAADSATFYDAGGPLAWSQDGTSAAGIAWVPSIATGSASLLVNTGTGGVTITGVPVFADTLTFESAEIP